MPEKKHHRVLIWAVFLSYSLIIALQMLYPVDRALPLATIFDKNVAWQNDEQLAKKLNEAGLSMKLRLKTGSKTITQSLGEAGAETRTDAMIRQATEYPFWQRFIPLSVLWQPAQVRYLSVTYNEPLLEAFVQRTSEQLASKPTNARLSIKDGALVAVQDKPGSEVSPKLLKSVLKQVSLQPGTNTIRVPTSNIEAETTEQDFAAVKLAATAALGRPVEIVVEDRLFSPDKKTVASWFSIGLDKGRPILEFDSKLFEKYLDTIDEEVGRKAGMTHVTITDGRESSRSTGEVGRAIDRSPLVTDVKTWLLAGEGSQYYTTNLHDVAPEVIYNNRYTATETGLRAYVRDISQQMDVHIALRQIGGNGWTAEARANESIPSASTYKLYVAKWLFHEMDAGKVSWNSSILGTTVSDCFDQMTIASTNACALEWLRQVGRENMNNYVWSLGFSHGTTFTHPEATHTTANDLLRFMTMLNDGSIISGSHRDRLLHSLSVHPYRYGIPTGSDGKVWDKVGFLWSYVHDAAIVKHLRGTYVMVVMTKGQSYGRIAEITRQIERIMYP